MKILSIRLKNLNSLKGEHHLDLTAEPLASAGLFVITGPTGAGKTTLLDAVTLAFYGKVARYGNDSNPEHVMTNKCGECSAEVVFEVSSGVYRAVWERHRARNKAGGALQQPKRYIYDASGEPLAQKIREAEEKIEELIGLNYDRFLRSVLLAQGDFARFLEATANKRAELLESLTGTAIYSRLGRLAHEEAGRREDALKDKEEGLENLEILTDEQRKKLEEDEKEEEKRFNNLKETIKDGVRMLTSITLMERAREKEKQAKAAKDTNKKERESAKAQLEELRQHRLTDPFVGDLATLEAADSAFISAETNRDEARTEYDEAKASADAANQMLRAAIEEALSMSSGDKKTAGEDLKTHGKLAKDARTWLDKHQGDAGLLDAMAGLASAVTEVKNARESVSDDWSDWKNSAAQILPEEASRLTENLSDIKEKQLSKSLEGFLSDAEKAETDASAKAKKDKNQLDSRQGELDKAKLVAQHKDQRHDLKSGEPCPLCGALEHPYAEGAAPSSEIESLEGKVTNAHNKWAKSRDAYEDLKRTVRDLSADRESLVTVFLESRKEIEDLELLLKPISEKPPVPGMEDALRDSLQTRERNFREHLEAERNAKNTKDLAGTDLEKAKKESSDLTKKLDKLAPLPARQKTLTIRPQDLLDVADAEAANIEAVQNEKTTATSYKDRKKDEKSAADRRDKISDSVVTAIAGTEFKTIDELRAARMSDDRAKDAEDLDKGLTEAKTTADALLREAESDIAKLRKEKVLEGTKATKFKKVQAELTEERDNLLEDQVIRRGRITTDDANRKLLKDKKKQLDEDRKAFVKWRRLREIIGSHDGSKFRRHAQTISLEILTRHANKHLAKLSKRYHICHDDADALNLQIEDLFQAGARRPMASLSGGESFLASLALALGLSDLSGRTVRIDSLFIDEGFGSLDSDTLETAITALESLLLDHKTVGVISHVDLLKERIGTQVVVEKRAGGVSQFHILPEVVT